MAQNRETKEVQNPCILEAGTQDDVLIWRQQSGLFYTKMGTPIRIGQSGMADTGMIVKVTITPEMVGKTIGVAVQPEFKVGKKGQSPEQEDWQTAVEKVGGVYELVRSVDEFNRLLERVRRLEV